MDSSSENRQRESSSFLAMKPPPCTGCIHYSRCEEEGLACEVFAAYASDPVTKRRKLTREPTRWIYHMIFYRVSAPTKKEAVAKAAAEGKV